MSARAKPISFCGFARDVLRVELTPAQRVLCAVAFDRDNPEELEGADRELAARMFGADVDVIPEAARDALVMVKGARIGGTYIAALYSLWRALTADLSGLAPGEQASATIIAPDQRLARQALRYANGAAKASPAIAALIDNDGADQFTLVRPDGARVAIECLPATRGGSAVRGRSLVSAVVSETAFLRSDDYQISDSEIHRALAPRVLAGGMIVLESTPWAQAGILHELFAQNHGAPVNALAAHCPTTLMRPDDKTLALVARERIRDPENAKREFDAEFLDAGTSNFFDPLQIQEAIHLGATSKPELGEVFAGADFAFRSDSSGLVICSRDAAGVISIVDVQELRPAKGAPLVPSEVVSTFAARCHKFRVSTILADGHNRETLTELLNEHEIAFKLGAVTQKAIGEAYSVVRDLFAEGRLRLPDHARLRRQLTDTVGKTSAGGALSIQHPRTSGGGHGDLVAAMVNAIAQARIGGSEQEATTLGQRRYGASDRRPGEMLDMCGERDRDEDARRTDQFGNDALVSTRAQRFHY